MGRTLDIRTKKWRLAVQRQDDAISSAVALEVKPRQLQRAQLTHPATDSVLMTPQHVRQLVAHRPSRQLIADNLAKCQDGAQQLATLKSDGVAGAQHVQRLAWIH